jgi:hypothetical protein
MRDSVERVQINNLFNPVITPRQQDSVLKNKTRTSQSSVLSHKNPKTNVTKTSLNSGFNSKMGHHEPKQINLQVMHQSLDFKKNSD